MNSPWQQLGLAPGASKSDIKHAYRKLVLQFHPDRHASSSTAEQEAAAARFKVITEAYNTLTDDRASSAYEASTTSSSSRGRGARAYHNVNTDWTYYSSHDSRGSGYTSRISRWELYQRLAKQSYRSFSQTLHISLAVLLVGGGLLFEFSHNAAWQARNKGKSFEEVQQLVKAQRETKAASLSSSSSPMVQNSSSSSSSVDGTGDGSAAEQQRPVYNVS